MEDCTEKREDIHQDLKKVTSEATLRGGMYELEEPPLPNPLTHPRCSQGCRACERLGHAPPHSLTFFLSLLNFFCRASSSSLSPGGITNMVAPGSGAGPKTSFSTVTAQGSHTVHTVSNPTPSGLPTLAFSSPYPLLKPGCLPRPHSHQPVLPLLSSNHGHQRLGVPRSPGRKKHPVTKTTAPDPPIPAGVSMATTGSERLRRKWNPLSALRATIRG